MSTRRRGKGEGSISQRADGRWMGRVNLGWREGKRCSKAVYGRTRREALDKLRAAQAAAEAGTLTLDERQTVSVFLNRWLAESARLKVRPRTLAGYESLVEHHIAPHIGQHRLTRLTPQHLQQWQSTLEAKHVSVHRRAAARTVLRIALNVAVRWRLVTLNVATLIDAPRVRPRDIAPLTPEQARVLIAAAGGNTLEGFVGVAVGCGLRLGEALGLKWSDIDLARRTLDVRRSVQRFGGDGKERRRLARKAQQLRICLKDDSIAPERRAAITRELKETREAAAQVKTSIQLTEPKTPRSRRTVALPAISVTALRAQRIRQLEDRLKAGASWNEQDFVFTSSVGTPLDPRNVTRQFKALLRAAGLPDIRLHDLRHSCATLLLVQGVSARVVMETLGHSQIGLTLNTYSHVLPQMQHEAAAKLDALFTGS